MEWILMEDGRLVNLSLVTDIRVDEMSQTASFWAAGVDLYSKSKIAYAYYLTMCADIPPVESPKES